MPGRMSDPIYVRCDRTLQEQMRKIAVKEDRSFSAAVRVAMREFVARRMHLLADEPCSIPLQPQDQPCQSYPTASSR